jgi:hypothetical protein
MNHPYVADLEPLRGGICDFLKRSPGERRMILEDEAVDGFATPAHWPGNPDEAHDRAVARRLSKQRSEFVPWVERRLVQRGDDAHPPETGARNSTASVP